MVKTLPSNAGSAGSLIREPRFHMPPLPTRACLVKAIVFPVVMYGCESWTIKKADAEKLMLLNCGVREDH